MKAPATSVLVVDLEIPADVASVALQTARQAGLTTILDPSPADRVTEASARAHGGVRGGHVDARSLAAGWHAPCLAPGIGRRGILTSDDKEMQMKTKPGVGLVASCILWACSAPQRPEPAAAGTSMPPATSEPAAEATSQSSKTGEAPVDPEEWIDVAQDYEPESPGPSVLVNIEPRSGSALVGRAALDETDDGVHVIVRVANTTFGVHGVHVHRLGNCSAEDASSAGPHFAPNGNPHGLPRDPKHHLGDLGNMVVEQNGMGRLEVTVPGATLKEDDHSFLGRAIIVHSDEDHGTQPAGDAGARIGCGRIE